MSQIDNVLDIHESEELLELQNIKKYFPVEHEFKDIFLTRSDERKSVKAVDDISFTVKKGDKFGICGESGCGKTTTARLIAGLDFETAGNFIWKNEITRPKIRSNKIFRRQIQFIFQNPFSSLNPRMKIGRQISHALIIQKIFNDERRRIYRLTTRGELGFLVMFFISLYFTLVGYTNSTFLNLSNQIIVLIALLCFCLSFTLYYVLKYRPMKYYYDDTVIKMLERIGLNPPSDYYDKYPHELSGGERQRIAIARALILNPELLVADEPTSMLDVSIRASILDLMQKLKDDFNLTIILITHDLATAKYFCNKIAIMYVGKIVEMGLSSVIFTKPKHPYTKALLNAIPIPESNHVRKEELPTGEVPDAINPPTGCRFHPRCRFSQEKCKNEEPLLTTFESDHQVACFYPLK